MAVGTEVATLSVALSAQGTDKVIARFRDGTLLKGTTKRFKPNRARFRLRDEDGQNHRVALCKLKALFFVKELGGNPDYCERKGFFTTSDLTHKVLVEFADGEVICGYSKSYSPNSQGFFLVPGDPNSNNICVFVVRSATTRVKAKPTDQSQEERHEEEPLAKAPIDA